MNKFPVKIIFIVLATVIPCSVYPAPQEGDKPYDFVGKDLEGNEIHISDFKDKVVVVSFWATWCPYCLKELPVLENIQKKVGNEQLQVIAANRGEAKSLVRKLDKAFKESGVELLLTHDKGGRTAKKWGVDGIPHLVLISKTGVISKVYVGYSESMLPSIIEELNSLLSFYVNAE